MTCILIRYTTAWYRSRGSVPAIHFNFVYSSHFVINILNIDIELVDDNSSNASSNIEEGRRGSVVSDDANLPPDLDATIEPEPDPEKLQLLQEKISSLQVSNILNIWR